MGCKNCLLRPTGNFFFSFLIFRDQAVDILMFNFTGAIEDFSLFAQNQLYQLAQPCLSVRKVR